MKKAFTLAEVLITLTIIGVIAALTIPNLMQKWSDQADISKIKKAYSMLNNAMKIAVLENGNISEWAWPEKKDYTDTTWNNYTFCADLFSQYLKTAQKCGSSIIRQCSRYTVKDLQGNDLNNSASPVFYAGELILTNGMHFYCSPQGITTSDGMIRLTVDINGQKAPNRVGYDIFWFFFTPKNGEYGDGWRAAHCDTTKPYSIADANNGSGCFSWIRKHGNMDYKYRDVGSEW